MDRIHLLSRLWEYQDKYRHISPEAIQQLAREFSISDTEVAGVASFYHFFPSEHAGKYTIHLNDSILAQHRGYPEIKVAFEAATSTTFGATSTNQLFGLYRTPCIGLSDQEPSALINFSPFTRLTPIKVRKIVSALQQGQKPQDICDVVEDQVHYHPVSERTVYFRSFEQGKALDTLKELSPEAVIERIKRSGLSGRGGAFYPTGLKWQHCNQYPGPRYIACNADEGEPGTFKDRILMNQMPGLLIEGIITAGYAVRAPEGIIYLRAEYRWLLPKLQRTLTAYQKMGWLGENLPGKEPFDFNIRIQLGAGAYVCGEETAMLESMEGKRGEPRVREYFPVQKGFLNQPTVVNNVETLCGAARVMELGADFFKSLGTWASTGTKLICISGDCARPGIYEIEWGMPLRQLLQLCGANDPYIIQMSGPAGDTLNTDDLDRRICGEDLFCVGTLTVFNQQRDLLGILKNFNDFFQQESCGTCTPCRIGNYLFGQKLEKIRKGYGDTEDIIALKEWDKVMKQTSRCGLGKTASNAIIQAIEKFPDYFMQRIQQSNGVKSFDLERTVADYDSIIKPKTDERASHDIY